MKYQIQKLIEDKWVAFDQEFSDSTLAITIAKGLAGVPSIYGIIRVINEEGKVVFPVDNDEIFDIMAKLNENLVKVTETNNNIFSSLKSLQTNLNQIDEKIDDFEERLTRQEKGFA